MVFCRKLKAQRFVLMNESKYFKTLLAAKNEDDSHCVNNEMSFETLEAMIKLMYTREFDKENFTEERIKGILGATKYFGLEVHEKLEIPILNILNVSNVLSFIQYNPLMSASLRDKINRFIFANIQPDKTYVQGPNF